jgi:hypothetical protein
MCMCMGVMHEFALCEDLYTARKSVETERIRFEGG